MFPNVLRPVNNNRCVFKVQYKETFLRDSWVHVHPHFRALSGLDNWEEKDLGNQRLSSSYISVLTQQDGRGKKTAKLVSPSFCKETRGGVELSRLFSQANFTSNWYFSNGISLVVDLLLSTSRWVASRHKPDDTAYMVIMCDKLPDLLLFFFSKSTGLSEGRRVDIRKTLWNPHYCR